MRTLIEKKHPHEGDNEMVNLEILLEQQKRSCLKKRFPSETQGVIFKILHLFNENILVRLHMLARESLQCSG